MRLHAPLFFFSGRRAGASGPYVYLNGAPRNPAVVTLSGRADEVCKGPLPSPDRGTGTAVRSWLLGFALRGHTKSLCNSGPFIY